MLRETAKQEFDISSGQRFKKDKEKSIQECLDACKGRRNKEKDRDIKLERIFSRLE